MKTPWITDNNWMKCEDPILCYSDGVRKVYRNFTLANPIHRARHNLVFDCRKCPTCRKKQATELALRCVLHASLYDRNCFLTLTYDESRPGYHNEFDYTDIQKFKKRLRRWVQYHYGQTIQIFNVHEYGKNGKKHWHLVVFNFDFPDKTLYTVKSSNRLYTSRKLEKLWPHGFNTIGDVTEASALYQAQYTQKDLKYGHLETKKKSHSKHSGIGRDYFLKHYEQILTLGYIPFGKRKACIPRYFQKLAHKHYSHFYAPENFEDTAQRKKLYSKFKLDEANRHMADLYLSYYTKRQIEIEELAQTWELEMEQYIYHLQEKPDFQKSGENRLHDLKNRIVNNSF